MTTQNIYTSGLDKNLANYTPLSPLTFLERAAYVYPHHTSVVHDNDRYTWAETYARARRLASALAKRGIGLGDTVSIMGFNTPQMYEAHFGVPMTGGVLHSINTRLDADSIAFQLQHAESKIFLTDTEASATIREALAQLENPPLVIDIIDPYSDGGDRLGELDYEALLAEGDPSMPGNCPPTNGRRSPSTTPPARRAIPKAWSITIAACI
ncbi:MAG: AMP-binding protein [Caldilineaceae bacterium]